VAVVSVPGPYAAITAHQALTAGLHVLLFSDNVPVADEVILKERASRLGRLVMGPGAGTAMLGGVGLGFANVVRPGRVGVVAAAGTGAQEMMTLLDRWGIGVSCVVGVGGRDLSSAVGGRMAADAVRALDSDPGTEVIALVSKPPDPAVADCQRQAISEPDGFLWSATSGGASSRRITRSAPRSCTTESTSAASSRPTGAWRPRCGRASARAIVKTCGSRSFRQFPGDGPRQDVR